MALTWSKLAGFETTLLCFLKLCCPNLRSVLVSLCFVGKSVVSMYLSLTALTACDQGPSLLTSLFIPSTC